jgi:L-rhamnose-H+ transport protein
MVGLGVLFHAIGGFAAGSFYIPFKRVKNWAWESYWLVGGVFSWILAPLLAAFLTVPDFLPILREAPGNSIFWCYMFGVLWGIGGLTFGLSMRYLGMSLGYSLALGFCAAFGTIIPPIYNGTFGQLFQHASGLMTLSGVFVCLFGIAICGWAGVNKERELSAEKKAEAIKEFNFVKGVWVAIFAGIMSACMAFAISAGRPIAQLAVDRNVAPLWQNNIVLLVALAGAFTTNFIWAVFLNIRNKTGKNYLSAGDASLSTNYIFSAMAGVIWYFQFMFYGMGSTKMGKYDFSSWTLHMAFIIIFSNIWGLKFHEWRGCSKRTLSLIIIGVVVVLLSTIIVGGGSYLSTLGK